MRSRFLQAKNLISLITLTVSSVSVSASVLSENIHIPFVQNQGQIQQENVDFYAATFGGTLFVTDQKKLVYRLPLKGDVNLSAGWSFSESLVGIRQSNTRGEANSITKINQFKGTNPQNWYQNIPTYERLNLGEVYKGIEVKLQAKANNIEKLFYIYPKANPSDIQIKVGGVSGLSVNEQQQLALKTSKGDILMTAPIAFQMIEGEKHYVDVAYAITGDQYGFSVGKYDTSQTLVIDPLLASTYIGGDNPNPGAQFNDDFINSVVTQGDHVYVAGITQSIDFPVTLGGFDESFNGGTGDAFVTKISADLSTIIASTYLGGSRRDTVNAMTIDANGTLYIAGKGGLGFPITTGAYNFRDPAVNSGGYVASLTSDLSSVIASAIPISGSGEITALASGNGGIYFGGNTIDSHLNVTPDAYDSSCGDDGNCDPVGTFPITTVYGFGGQLSADLSTLNHLTYLDEGRGVSGIAIAADTSVYISEGLSYTKGADQRDGYVSRFDSGLSNRLSTAPFSAAGRTHFYDIKVGNGYVIAVGESDNPNVLPVSGTEFDPTCGSDGACNPTGPLSRPAADGIVVRFSPDLQTINAFTYLGGSFEDRATSVRILGDESLVIAGNTTSVDFPVSANAADSGCGTDNNCNASSAGVSSAKHDGFIVRMAADLSVLHYGSYLGGMNDDFANAVDINDAGQAYVVGFTRSTNFPVTTGAFDTNYGGGSSDAYISLFDISGGDGDGDQNAAPVSDAGSDQTVQRRVRVQLDGGDSFDTDGQIVSYRWTQISGKTVRLRRANRVNARFRSPGVRRGTTRTLVFQLEVTDNEGATDVSQTTVTVTR